MVFFVSISWAEQGKMRIYVIPHPTAEHVKILPETYPVPGVSTDEISVIVCAGEYEPASFVVRAVTNITKLTAEAGRLQGINGFIPGSNVDIRVVKCWYQDMGQGRCMLYSDSGRRVLVPELLLKDDSLVRVDRKTEDNYLKLRYPDGEKYVCISQKSGIPGIGRDLKDFPVRDSSVLQPVDILPDSNKQFWLTIKVPEHTEPGIYTGKIELGAPNEEKKTLKLRVRVLPIKLSAPYYSSSIYYSGLLNIKNKEQYRKEIENLAAHGVDNPVFGNGFGFQGFFGIGGSMANFIVKPPNRDFYKGILDNVSMYRRALTAEEITENYKNKGRPGGKDEMLAGCWQFDEGKGETAADGSSRGNDGKIVGAKWAEGLSGTALEFDGMEKYINCGDTESLRITTGDLTLVGWIKTASGGTIISTACGMTDGSWYSMGLGSDGRIVISLATHFPVYYTRVTGTTCINDGKWHQAAVVRDSANGMVRVYVDGKLEKEAKDNTAGQSLTGGLEHKIFKEALDIRKQAGMNNDRLYLSGFSAGNPQDKDALERLKREVREVISFVRPYGIKEVYLYGMDESKGELLRSQRAAWEAVHEAGGRIFVAGHRQRQYHKGADHYELVGDLQDLFICAERPDAAEPQKWHSAGHEIGVYGNPQGGVENPAIYRRNYGLTLWKYNYDVAMTYAYQGCGGSGAGWNDFCGSSFRPHMMAYPAVDGVIDTIQWEGYREGVDDVRYLTTLLGCIEKAKQSKDKETRTAAQSAELYLSGLDVENRSLDTIRLEIMQQILKLQKLTGGRQ